MKKVLDFIIDYWEVIGPLVTMILLRIVPTKKNYCIIEKVMQFLDKAIPNRRKVVRDTFGDATRNRKGKTVLPIVLLMLLSTLGYTQTIVTTKAVNFFGVTDSTLMTTTPIAGRMYYNTQSNKFRFYQNGAWYSFLTNSAANTELMKSNGANAVPSGLFIPSAGNLNLGSSSISGDRTISMISSSTNSSLTIKPKASGAFLIENDGVSSGLIISPTSTNTNVTKYGTGTLNISGSNGTAGNDISLQAGTGTSTTGGNINLRGGLAPSQSSYGSVVIDALNTTLGLAGHTTVTSTTLKSAAGNNSGINGLDFTIAGGNAFSSGNGNGGSLNITSGIKNGSGIDGDISINANAGTTYLDGTVVATTQSAGDNSTKVATTEYVDTKVISAIKGGTGQTTWTTGQIPYASASNTISKLNIGSSGQFLSVVGGVPSWVASPGSIFTTPEAYGAIGDGSTNDQAALQSCVNSGLPCAIGIKNYRTNTTITVPSNAVIFGYGVLSIISTTSNISVFTVQGKNINFEKFAIVGNSTGAAQRGIDVTGNGTFSLDYSQNRLNNMYFQDLNHAGVYVTNVVGASGSIHTGAISALNCFAEHCGTGYYMDVRAEYNIFSDCQAHNCTSQGLFISGGNNGWVGGQITDNVAGVNVTRAAGEGNDAHGVVTGAKINHNTTAVTSSSILNGFVFSNNLMYNNGSVNLVGSTGIKFIGNTFGGTTALTINNCPNTEFTNNSFTTTPTATLTTTTPLWSGNTFTLGAVQPSFVKNTLPGTQRSSVATQFDVTSSTTLANVTGLTTLVNLVAGMRYCFDATLFTSSNSAGGVKFAIGGTATATAITYDAITFDNATIAAQTRATSLGTSVGSATAVTAALTRITGTIQVNAAGTLTVQFAQNASNGTASSVLVGSIFEIKELL